MIKSVLILLITSITLNSFSQNTHDLAVELLKGSLKKIKKNDLKGALSEITKSIELDSTYYGAYYNKALIESKQEKYDEALELGSENVADLIAHNCK